jgi:hypothetical protein
MSSQYRHALTRVGCKTSLGQPSKMPCPAYSIPATQCQTGRKLAQIPGSTCHGCYALKGRYRFPNVEQAMHARLDSLTSPTWVADMVTAIQHETSDYFRWHDSGDLQSADHLDKIVQIAQQLPHIQFWLPTREYRLVADYVRDHDLPPNLIIRVSAAMIDGEAPKIRTRQGTTLPVSYVHDKAPARGQVCPAPTQGNQCGSCRACWTRTVDISYHRH